MSWSYIFKLNCIDSLFAISFNLFLWWKSSSNSALNWYLLARISNFNFAVCFPFYFQEVRVVFPWNWFVYCYFHFKKIYLFSLNCWFGTFCWGRDSNDLETRNLILEERRAIWSIWYYLLWTLGDVNHRVKWATISERSDLSQSNFKIWKDLRLLELFAKGPSFVWVPRAEG